MCIFKKLLLKVLKCASCAYCSGISLINYTKQMGHGFRQNIFKWVFGLKGKTYGNCSFHTSHLLSFKSTCSAVWRKGNFYFRIASYSQQFNKRNCIFHKVSNWHTSPSPTGRTLPFCTTSSPSFRHLLLHFCSSSSSPKYWCTCVWWYSSSYFWVATGLLIFFSFFSVQ